MTNFDSYYYYYQHQKQQQLREMPNDCDCFQTIHPEKRTMLSLSVVFGMAQQVARETHSSNWIYCRVA